jgi:hypothetical protein
VAAIPVNAGSAPAAFIACLPCLACTVTSACRPADAGCTPASLPATRNPVSPNCATSEVTSALMITSATGDTNAATLRAVAAVTAGDGAQPDISAIAAAARSRDRNCPCHRYVPSAAARGPCCTGAVTPSGACALAFAPHPAHSRSIS